MNFRAFDSVTPWQWLATGPRGKSFPIALIAMILSCPMSTLESAEELTVPVVDIKSAATAEMVMTPANQSVQPTLPSGKLPQYQTNINDTDLPADDPRLRLLLALPTEVLVVDVAITFDGAPFRRKRHDRVRAALRRLEDLNSEVSPEENLSPQNSSEVEMLKRYFAATGRPANRDEVRSYFDQRLEGPTVLTLKDSFQSFRADQKPLFAILDRDHNSVLSHEEIDEAANSLIDIDFNRNDIIDYQEINEAASSRRHLKDPDFDMRSVVHLVPSREHAAVVYADLLRMSSARGENANSLPLALDPDNDGKWNDEELSKLNTVPADWKLSIDFRPTNGAMAISADWPETQPEDAPILRAVNSSIVLVRNDCEVWLSAVQSTDGDQLSIGAVYDGYPLLPVLDTNHDGRFTLRELKSLPAEIRKFDTDADGQVRIEELRPVVRIGFGRGPSVHHLLAEIRSGTSPDASARPENLPDWFVRMDRNHDGDLTRNEFPGTDEQFAELDRDRDSFVSAKEAIEFERTSSSQLKK